MRDDGYITEEQVQTAKAEPITLASRPEKEKAADAEYFAERKYELEKTEPFLYYVYRRRLECANVRIVFACLLAGVSEAEIKKRLRAI